MNTQNPVKNWFERVLSAIKIAIQTDATDDYDTQKTINWGIVVIGFGFGGFLLWAALAPLDEGVPCEANVAIDTKRKVIQHLTGGIVETVNVKEGQIVKQGDILMTLDDELAKARQQEIQQHYFGVRAMEGRLIAEQNGEKTIKFHDDLIAQQNNPLALQYMHNQENMLRSRQAKLASDIQGLKEAIQEQEAYIRGQNAINQSVKSQLELINRQWSGVKDLVNEGYAPKNQQRDLEIRIAQLTGSQIESQSAKIKAQNAIDGLKQRILGVNEEYQKEIQTQMNQVQLEVESDAQKLKAYTEELNRTEIRSPVDGQVVGIQVQTVGSTIAPGQRIMDIVPLDEGLLFEVKILPHLIDRVKPDLPADIRISTFANTPQLNLLGKVESVSLDLITDPNANPMMPNAKYYLARVSLTPEGVDKLGNRVLKPGMQAMVVIKTGERSLLKYIINPLTKRFASSLKEI